MKNLLHIKEQLISNSTKNWSNQSESNLGWIEDQKVIDIISKICELVTVPDNVTILPMNLPSILILYNDKEIITMDRNFTWEEDGKIGYEPIPVTADSQMFRKIVSTNRDFKNFDEDTKALSTSINSVLVAISRSYPDRRIAYCPYSLNLMYNPEWHYGEKIIPFWRAAKKVI
jgi:hypothetical protein